MSTEFFALEGQLLVTFVLPKRDRLSLEADAAANRETFANSREEFQSILSRLPEPARKAIYKRVRKAHCINPIDSTAISPIRPF